MTDAPRRPIATPEARLQNIIAQRLPGSDQGFNRLLGSTGYPAASQIRSQVRVPSTGGAYVPLGTGYATGPDRLPIGPSTNVYASGCIAAGNNAVAGDVASPSTSFNAIAIGPDTIAKGRGSVALGEGPECDGDFGFAMNGFVGGTYGLGIGYATNVGATHAGSAAIATDSGGAGAATTASNQIRLGTANHTTSIPGRLVPVAATTTRASFNLPHGTAPTTPVDGDMWTTTAGLYVRINGTTVGPLS